MIHAARPSSTNIPAQGCDDVIWAVLLVMLVLTGLMQLALPFTLDARGLALPAAMLFTLTGIAAFYRRARPDARIMAMVSSLQQMILFSAVGAILSYMMAARGAPLRDDRLAGWDWALGLDWPSALHWLDAHALAAPLMKLGYETLMPQMAALIIALALWGRLAALRTVVLAAMIGGLAAILTSAFMPALGAYAHFGIVTGDYIHIHPAITDAHMADVMGLRDGTLRMLSLDHMQGIVTFPSYHAVLATVFGWGFSRVPQPLVRWPGMTMAALTLLATPVDGGHYFSDVIAGCLVATLALWVARRAIGWKLAGVRRMAGTPAPIPLA